MPFAARKKKIVSEKTYINEFKFEVMKEKEGGLRTDFTCNF